MTSTHTPTSNQSKPGGFPIHQPRIDHITAEQIEEALILQNTFGTLCALEFLKAKGIDHQITQRILGQPENRRQPD